MQAERQWEQQGAAQHVFFGLLLVFVPTIQVPVRNANVLAFSLMPIHIPEIVEHLSGSVTPDEVRARRHKWAHGHRVRRMRRAWHLCLGKKSGQNQHINTVALKVTQ